MRYTIAAILVLVAIIIVDGLPLVAAGCIGAAGVFSIVKERK